MFTANFDISQIKPGDARLEMPRFQGGHLVNNKNLMRELDEFSRGKGINTAQLALAWLLAKEENIIPIPGTKRRPYLEMNAKAVDIDLSREDVEEIERIIAKYPDTGERYPKSPLKLIQNNS